jgi:hypothetical protein
MLTIGVLTKADTVQDGEHAQWIKILNNQSHMLRRGYYMTRLAGPTKNEAGQTWEETRKIEKSFFKKGPWTQVQDKNRLGISSLTDALSSGLAEMIADKFPLLFWSSPICRLPSLKMELLNKARQVQGELDRLPQSFAENPQAMLLGLCSEFVSEIGKYTHGNSTHPAFFQDINSEFWSLAQEISDTRPRFEIACGKMKSEKKEGAASSEKLVLLPELNVGSDEHPERKEAGLQGTLSKLI